MATIHVNIVVLALLGLVVSADNSDESSKEVVIRNSPVFNSISKIYTQLHSPGTRQQNNQYYPNGRIPDRSYTRFSEVTNSGFAKKQFLSSYQDKTVRRMGSRGQFEALGHPGRIQGPHFSSDRPAGQFGQNEPPPWNDPQNGLSWNGRGNREPGFGRRDQEGDRYTERGYGYRAEVEEGSKEEGEEEEEGGEEVKEEQSTRRRNDDRSGRPRQGSSSSSNSRLRTQGSYGDRPYAQGTASQDALYPFNRYTRNPVSARYQRQQYPGNQFQQFPGNQFQQNPASLFQQNRGNQFQHNPANKNQQNPVNPFQQNPRNQPQLNSGNLFQQNRGNQFQQNPANQNQLNPGNQFQQNPANQNQLNPGNQFQQNPTVQFRPHQRNQNQMRTNGQIQENQYQQNRVNGQPGIEINQFSGSRIANNQFQQPTVANNQFQQPTGFRNIGQ